MPRQRVFPICQALADQYREHGVLAEANAAQVVVSPEVNIPATLRFWQHVDPAMR